MSTHLAPPRQRVLLIIMDGIAVNPSKKDNAVALASTPNLDRIYSSTPTCLVEASGKAVGLPDGQMGNSEVGHMTLGAGTVLKQDLVKVSDSITSGEFVSNKVVLDSIARAKANNRPMHLLGLVSDGGVHSHVDHLIALITLCAQQNVTPIIHMITDGRDTAPKCSEKYLKTLAPALVAASGSIATVIGRYYAMDRDKRWDRIEQAWRAIMLGEGARAPDASAAIAQSYAAGHSDEFIPPTVLDTHILPIEGDEFLFFNFRNDRPRELSEALAFIDFPHFDRTGAALVSLTTMTRYESSYPFEYAFSKDFAKTTLGQVVSDAGLTQLRVAETEKYPHVTFFFNSGADEALAGEQRLLTDSPKVATYDLQPEMSAEAIAVGVETALTEMQHALIVVNFANGDMVGHTGVRDAVVAAVEVVDEKVGRLWDVAQECGYSIILTADHGNADMLLDPVTGDTHTQHTTFPVVCAIHDTTPWRVKNGYGLSSIAPTILELMGLPQPASMSGESLLIHDDV